MSASRKRAHTPGGRGGKQKRGSADSVEVVCRMTPYNGQEPCLLLVDETNVKAVAPTGCRQRNGQPYPDKLFEFGHVFDETDTQENVFERTAKDLVHHAITGRNSLLFTYGVTGSGKTYTMTGNASARKCGIVPRTLDTIFNSIENQIDKCVFVPNGRNAFEIRAKKEAAMERLQRGLDITCEIDEGRYVERTRVEGYNDDLCCAIFVSYVEIYNNSVYDLLDNDDDTPQSLDVLHDANKAMYVYKAREMEVATADEALSLLLKGDRRRRVSDTLLNKESSRSHSVFTIKVVMAPMESHDEFPVRDASQIVVGQLSLVDLAGSERTKRTFNTGERLNEASKINQSLMTLRMCIEKLRRNQRTTLQEAVPYRDTKLTLLFKNFFEGSGKVRMIICANPRSEDYEENLNVLAFAEESQAVQVTRAEVKTDYLLDDNRPAVPRRFFTRWNNELESHLAPALSSVSFNVPQLDWDKCILEDDSGMTRLKETVARLLPDVMAFDERLHEMMSGLEPALRRTLCQADYDAEQKEITSARLALEEERNRVNETEIKKHQREIASLRTRLAAFEEDDEERIRTEEHLRRANKAGVEKLRQQRDTMQAALSIADSRSPSVAQLRSQFTAVSNENIRPGRDRGNATTSTQVSASSTESRRHEREARADRPAYYNPKYNHRRSQSASRVLDHQPTRPVPTGNIFRARMPSGSRHTRAPKPEDLRAASSYLLTHQELDQEGNLSTSLYKGECIPTAGGGTAVHFNDIEKLSHESPTKSTTRL